MSQSTITQADVDKKTYARHAKLWVYPKDSNGIYLNALPFAVIEVQYDSEEDWDKIVEEFNRFSDRHKGIMSGRRSGFGE